MSFDSRTRALREAGVSAGTPRAVERVADRSTTVFDEPRDVEPTPGPTVTERVRFAADRTDP